MKTCAEQDITSFRSNKIKVKTPHLLTIGTSRTRGTNGTSETLKHETKKYS